MITNYWEEKEVKNVDDQLPFAIHENDKTFIRSVIVEAIARSPKLLRYVLKVYAEFVI